MSGDSGYVGEASGLARPLSRAGDLDPLLERIGDARFVLLGEASHGTHEYYAWRAELTRRLVAEQGFSFVAVERDWPDCYRVNRWLKRGDGDGRFDARQALRSFQRWPAWMWANEEVAGLLDWLHGVNAARPPERRVGFYGLDVYSLWDSMRAVIGYLEEHEPGAVESAHQAWRCFEPYGEDPQRYARATKLVPASCHDEVVALLVAVQAGAASVGDGTEARFDAEQNAAAAAGAERYYRAMVGGGPEAWNIRDTHMADTLDRVVQRHGPGARAVVWEHNTHVGDARATDMADAGMVNLGQLVRERHGADGVVLVGFGSYEGEVVAAEAWGAPPQRMPVPPARPGSHEEVLHQAGLDRALLLLDGKEGSGGWLGASLAHRAIGVVYRPALERAGNYVLTVLGRRYDAFCYLDRTTPLRPLVPG